MNLICKEELLEDIKARFSKIPTCQNISEPIKAIALAIQTAPTIESRPQGKWEKTATAHRYCSNCMCFPHEEYEATTMGMNFCPNCGAKMEVE